MGGDWLPLPLQDHTFNFGWGYAPDLRPHWWSPLAGWVGLHGCPLSKNTPPLFALRASIVNTAFFPDPTI